MNCRNRFSRFVFVILVLTAAFLLTSCAARSDKGGQLAMEEASAMAPVARSSKSVGSVADAPSLKDDSGEANPEPESDNVDRKRVYNGSAGLVVEDLEDTRRTLETLAVDSGGYVESSYSDYLVLRVPAGLFNMIFEKILALGRVEYHRVETWDVTEAYADTQRRLDTASETRNRLYELLEKSNDPKKRALILREIGRLTEEIESLKQQMAVLDARIAYSRITVELIPRLQADYSTDSIPFPWIANLDPLFPAGSSLRARLDLDLGDNFAVFTQDEVFLAENSNGVHVSVSSIPNEPRGDELFWQQALLYHLSPYYAESSAVEINIGNQELYGVEFLSKDRVPFRHFVGVVIDRKHLHIVQIFSPDSEYDFNPVYRAFEEGSLK